jgi:hypothetical protein
MGSLEIKRVLKAAKDIQSLDNFCSDTAAVEKHDQQSHLAFNPWLALY